MGEGDEDILIENTEESHLIHCLQKKNDLRGKKQYLSSLQYRVHIYRSFDDYIHIVYTKG